MFFNFVSQRFFTLMVFPTKHMYQYQSSVTRTAGKTRAAHVIGGMTPE